MKEFVSLIKSFPEDIFSYERIIIIGKGSSCDLVDWDAMPRSLIINLNDSFRIAAGQVRLFNNVECFQEADNEAAPINIFPSSLRHEFGKVGDAMFVDEHVGDIDTYFELEEFALNNSLLMSALKICHLISERVNRILSVYLVGFDFSLDSGFSKKCEVTYDSDDGFQSAYIRAQERTFLVALKKQSALQLSLSHVGRKQYSAYDVEGFNKLAALLTLDDSKVVNSKVSDEGVVVVAEITTNHFGDRDRLSAMIRSAALAGADFVKFQKRSVDDFYTDLRLKEAYDSPFGDTFRDYRLGLELSHESFKYIDSLCSDLNIGWFASVLDIESYRFFHSLPLSMIKLPSTISEHRDYLKQIATEWSGPVVISTGLTDKAYEEFIFKHFSNQTKLYLLQCTSAYPTRESDAGVGVVRHYNNLAKSSANIIPGYSSHDIGSLCSMLAVAAGAKMIEKHVKFGSVPWAHFDEVALDLSTAEFHDFVKEIRRAEAIVGGEEKVVRASEHHKYWLDSPADAE